MNIWLDTTNKKIIQQAKQLGVLFGVTTNPELIALSQQPLKQVLKSLLHEQEGPVTAQVVGSNTIDMVQQGQSLYNLSTRLIIKVPVTPQGLEAIHLLSRQGIPTMATVVFHPRQALMAALAGANYVAPYISRIENAGENPWIVLKQIHDLFVSYQLKTQVLGASLQSVDHVLKCGEIGINNITIKKELFEQLIEDHPLTTERIQHFSRIWDQSNASFAEIIS